MQKYYEIEGAKMDSPLVTIIVPVYNCENYLEKCICNLLTQTYQNLQIIFVNDGSTDNSLKLCERIDDRRVEIYSKPNGGASSARNFGLLHRKGQYILFVDSDDYLAENAVETLVTAALSEAADCVYFEADNITEDSSIKIKKNGLRHAIQYPATDGSSLITMLLEHKNYHAVPFLYFAKSEIYDRGLKFTEGIMFEDELFSFELLRMCKKVFCLKQILYYRNVRANSVMTSTGRESFRFHSIAVVYKKLYDRYPEHRDEAVYNAYIARIALLCIGYYKQIPKNDRQNTAMEYAEIRKQILENKKKKKKELVVRCYGELLWRAYIFPGRVLGRLKRRFKHGK